jgi:hypothetical protein
MALLHDAGKTFFKFFRTPVAACKEVGFFVTVSDTGTVDDYPASSAATTNLRRLLEDD